MNRLLLGWLCLGLIAWTAPGCDDEGGGDTPQDAGGDAAPVIECPTPPLDPEDLTGACCYRASNADRLDHPALRVTELIPESPESLENIAVVTVINGALVDELFNWVLEFDFSVDPPMLRTGFARRNEGGTFSFVVNGAPTGDPGRWDPVNAQVRLVGETVSGDPIPSTITVPVFDDANPDEVALELPLNNLELIEATLSENRSCIGRRIGEEYDPSDGLLTTYIRVEDAVLGHVSKPPMINANLCNFIAGCSSVSGDRGMAPECEAIPRVCADPRKHCYDPRPEGEPDCGWGSLPDSLCGEGGCTQNTPDQTDVCDPTGAAEPACNAWKIRATFAAHGVEVVATD